MTSLSLFQNPVILKRHGLANFADLVKVTTTLIKTTYEKSIKVKRIINYVVICNFCLYFLV